MVDDGKYFIAFGRPYRGKTRKAAESGQHAIGGRKIETGKMKRLPSAAPDVHARVNMAGKEISIMGYRAIDIIDVVGKRNVFDGQLIDRFYPEFFIPFVLQYIVVAHHEADAELGKIMPPFFE